MKDEPPEPPPPRKRMSWLRREGIDLGDAAVQFIAVVIGIVLGVLITQWVAQRQQRHAAQEAVHAIRAELIANRASLRHNATRWYNTAERQMEAPENQNQSPRPCYRWKGWNGDGVALITDGAYQTAIATQALAHMPFKQAHQIAEIYSHQRHYLRAFSFLQQNILMKPQTLVTCVFLEEGLGTHHDGQLARAYKPLIGPIKKWPKSPPNPLKHPYTLK